MLGTLLVVHAFGLIPMDAYVPPVIDFSAVTSTIAAFGTAYGPAVLITIGSALSIAAIIWGFPKLLGLFKKTAK